MHSVGIDENTFIEKKKALFELYKTPITDSNVAQIMLNELLVSAFNRRDYQSLKKIYWTMAIIAFGEKREFFHILIEVRKYELLIINQSQLKYGCDEVKIMVPVGECESCSELEGKVFKTYEILNNPPLPNPNCSSGWCNCCFQPVLDIVKTKNFLDAKFHK